MGQRLPIGCGERLGTPHIKTSGVVNGSVVDIEVEEGRRKTVIGSYSSGGTGWQEVSYAGRTKGQGGDARTLWSIF